MCQATSRQLDSARTTTAAALPDPAVDALRLYLLDRVEALSLADLLACASTYESIFGRAPRADDSCVLRARLKLLLTASVCQSSREAEDLEPRTMEALRLVTLEVEARIERELTAQHQQQLWYQK